MTQQKPHSKILSMLLQSIAVIALLIMKALKWYFVAIYAIYDKIKIIATIFLTLTLICSLIAPGEYNVRFIILLLIGIHAVGIPAVLLFGLIESIINKLNAYLGFSAEDDTLEDIDDDSYDDTEDDLTIDEMIFMDMMDEDD